MTFLDLRVDDRMIKVDHIGVIDDKEVISMLY